MRRTILTHAHIDHVGGTKAFPNAAVYGSPVTSDALDQPMPIDAYKQFMPAFDEEFDDLAELGTRPVTHLVDGAAQLTPRIEVLPASGHTAGDLLVLVADTDVCFAGDLCFFGVTPLAFQGDPAAWADVLDVVVELADVIVPGHGPVGGERRGARPAGLPARVRRGRRRRRARSRPDHGTRGSTATATRSTSSAPRCSPSGDDVLPPSMLKAIGLG